MVRLESTGLSKSYPCKSTDTLSLPNLWLQTHIQQLLSSTQSPTGPEYFPNELPALECIRGLSQVGCAKPCPPQDQHLMQYRQTPYVQSPKLLESLFKSPAPAHWEAMAWCRNPKMRTFPPRLCRTSQQMVGIIPSCLFMRLWACPLPVVGCVAAYLSCSWHCPWSPAPLSYHTFIFRIQLASTWPQSYETHILRKDIVVDACLTQIVDHIQSYCHYLTCSTPSFSSGTQGRKSIGLQQFP